LEEWALKANVISPVAKNLWPLHATSVFFTGHKKKLLRSDSHYCIVDMPHSLPYFRVIQGVLRLISKKKVRKVRRRLYKHG